MTSEELLRATALLSSERVDALKRITGSEKDAIELHHEMLLVSAALMPLAALLEIAIRNAVCDQLRSLFGAPNWLTSPPPPFVWRGEESDSLRRATRHAQRAMYAKKSQREKRALDDVAFPQGLPPNLSHEQRAKERQKAISITQGQLIAQLSLFFWKRLFSSDYQATLWDRSLKRIFPDKTVRRPIVAGHLEAVYQARNRIAHHEPLYGTRLADALAALEFLKTELFKGTEASSALRNLCKPHEEHLRTTAEELARRISQYSVTTQ